MDHFGLKFQESAILLSLELVCILEYFIQLANIDVPMCTLPRCLIFTLVYDNHNCDIGLCSHMYWMQQYILTVNHKENERGHFNKLFAL